MTRLLLHIEHVVVDAAFAGDAAQLQADLAAELTRLLGASVQGDAAGAGWAGRLGGGVQLAALPAVRLAAGGGALGERMGRAVFEQLAGVSAAPAAGAPPAGALR